MSFGSQIRNLRMNASLSQEELAQRVFVTRQSVSNWENDRTYPDIKSLLLLCEVFSVSLDTLVKGEMEALKREIDVRELESFRKDSVILTVLFIGLIILPIPLVRLWKWWGMVGYLALFGVTMGVALRLERLKKKADIQTYREIVAFTEGKSLTEIEKAIEKGKRPYQRALLAAGSGLLAVVVALILSCVMEIVI